MPWSDAPGLSEHALVVRSVAQEDGPPQSGVVHEHTRRPTPAVFMNTQKNNSNFHRPTWACGGRPPAPKQDTPTTVDGAFDGRPLQHRESRFWASNPKCPLVHEQTTPAASRTAGRRFFFPASVFFFRDQICGHLGLVDLSQTPDGTFFREVHPASENGCKQRQNRLLPAVCDLAPKAQKTFFYERSESESEFLYIASSGVPMLTLL